MQPATWPETEPETDAEIVQERGTHSGLETARHLGRQKCPAFAPQRRRVGTSKDQLVNPEEPKKKKGMTREEIAKLELEMESVERDLKAVEDFNWGDRGWRGRFATKAKWH
jgi:hypothetical protein